MFIIYEYMIIHVIRFVLVTQLYTNYIIYLVCHNTHELSNTPFPRRSYTDGIDIDIDLNVFPGRISLRLYLHSVF